MTETAEQAAAGAEALERVIRSAEVVLFRSELTDTRAIADQLKLRGVPYNEVVMEIRDATTQQRISELSEMTGWKTLPQIFVNGRFVGGEREFFESSTADNAQGKASPLSWALTAKALGYGGLIPFLLIAVLLWVPVQGVVGGFAHQLLLAYGAVILAFIGAVHWGAILKAPSGTPFARPELVVSVMPALAGWVSLAVPPTLAYPLQIMAFAGWYVYEHFTVHRRLFPGWYRALRRRLTVIVLASLIAGAYAPPRHGLVAGGSAPAALDAWSGEPRGGTRRENTRMRLQCRSQLVNWATGPRSNVVDIDSPRHACP